MLAVLCKTDNPLLLPGPWYSWKVSYLLTQRPSHFILKTALWGRSLVVVQLLIYVWLFATPWTAACQASLSFTVSQSCSNSCPLRWWSHPTILSSATPFCSCSQSFPASGSFPMSQLFASGGQSTGASASASVLLMNIQGWFPLGFTGLIS